MYCGIARQVRPVITMCCKKLVGREGVGEMEGARGRGDGNGGLPVILLGKHPIEEQKRYSCNGLSMLQTETDQ